MAEGKKSFIAYCNWGDTFDELSNEESGKLIKHLFDYVRDKNPVAPDKLTKMMFIQMKQALKRDLVKYGDYIDKQRVNGAKGGRPKKPKKPNPLLENPTEPKKADSVNDSVSVNVNEEKKTKAFSFSKELISMGGKKHLVTDWMQVRKTKRLSNTNTALTAFLKEWNKSDKDLNQILEKCCAESWGGFKASWKWSESVINQNRENNGQRVKKKNENLFQV